MTDLAICLATDAGYLFPTFAAAAWLRQRAAPGEAEVTILGIDLDAAARAALAPACEGLGIGLIALPRARISGASTTFARLFLAEILPAHIARILYLDGDTQYPGDLAPLLAHRPAPGRFLAVRDPLAFTLPGTGRLARSVAAHVAAIGLTPEQGACYVNAGVLLAEREGWARIGHDAWHLFSTAGGAMRFADQDAINIVGHDRHLPLSLAWNFPAYLFNTRLGRLVRPRIVHFMSNPKPWHGRFPPWGEAEFGPYAAIAARFPALAPYRPRMAASRRLRYQLQQRYKSAVEAVSWGTGPRQARLIAYEQSALLLPADSGVPPAP